MQSTPDSVETLNYRYYIGQPGNSAFAALTTAVQQTLRLALDRGKGQLFSVDTQGLYRHYLGSFAGSHECQYHTCNCCHSFIKHYGGLVWISEEGNATSAVWDWRMARNCGSPAEYIAVAGRMQSLVEARIVDNQFFWKDTLLGTPEAGGFNHFWTPMPDCKFEATLTPNQAMAARLEDRKHLSRALNLMPAEHIDRAVALLEAGSLIQPEKLLPMGKFLQALQKKISVRRTASTNNILWHAIGYAARGWCTPRDSAFGALVEDIASGRPLATIVMAHNKRMDPLHYQRPQVAPTAGNIRQAEKIVEQLGIAPSLRRRTMALCEAQMFWRPLDAAQKVGEGVFAHLTPKGVPAPNRRALNTQPTKMTYAKFERDVLPRALKLRFKAPSHGGYGALTTAVIPDAPPIFKWDHLTQRNPHGWYTYSKGSPAFDWGLRAQQFVEVLGLTRLPPEWFANNGFFQELTVGRVLAVLEGARDGNNYSMAIYPSFLRNELHEVRATIEAHSKSGKLEPELRPHAAGYIIHGHEELLFEVTTQNGVELHIIDRLE